MKCRSRWRGPCTHSTWRGSLRNFSRRLIGAALLDADTYEEVEADHHATLQASALVLVSSLMMAIGAMGFSTRVWSTILLLSAGAVAGWIAWAFVTLGVGGHVLPEPGTRVDARELLRTLGFSAAPGLLCVIGVFRPLTVPVFLVTLPWMLATMVVAIRQALDYHSTVRAFGVCVLGWALVGAIFITLGVWFGPRVF